MADPSFMESTASLLIKVREGDDQAREELFGRYLPMLQRWARGRLPGYARDSLDTDDLVQVTLLRALRRVDEFEPRREGAFLAYLRRILMNRVRDEIKRTVTRAGQPSGDGAMAAPLPSAVEKAIGRQMVERYEAALEQLGEQQREAVILRLEFGCSHQEVADAIEAPSANAARMTVSRALVKITELIDAPA